MKYKSCCGKAEDLIRSARGTSREPVLLSSDGGVERGERTARSMKAPDVSRKY